MLEYLQESQEVGSLNKTTICKPVSQCLFFHCKTLYGTKVLTVYYLDILVKSLRLLGLHPLTLPVLNLQLVITMVTLANSTALSKLLHMR